MSTPEATRIHLDVVLPTSDAQHLDRLTKEKNRSKPEIIRKALSLYFAVVDATDNHLNVVFISDEGRVKGKVIGYH